MFQKAKIFSLKCACNYLRFGDATFSVFICNFFQKVLAKNTDKLPELIAQDLESKIVDYDNVINKGDADFEMLSS